MRYLSIIIGISYYSLSRLTVSSKWHVKLESNQPLRIWSPRPSPRRPLTYSAHMRHCLYYVDVAAYINILLYIAANNGGRLTMSKDGCHCWTRTNAVSSVTDLQSAAFAARRQVAIDGRSGGYCPRLPRLKRTMPSFPAPLPIVVKWYFHPELPRDMDVKSVWSSS